MSYQKCPICNGAGNDPFVVLSYTLVSICPTCKGTRIIDDVTGIPPVVEQKHSIFEPVENSRTHGVEQWRLKSKEDKNYFTISKIVSLDVNYKGIVSNNCYSLTGVYEYPELPFKAGDIITTADIFLDAQNRGYQLAVIESSNTELIVSTELQGTFLDKPMPKEYLREGLVLVFECRAPSQRI